MSTCPGDCCRLIHINGCIEYEIEFEVVHGREAYHEGRLLVDLFWPGEVGQRLDNEYVPHTWGPYECAAFNRATRQCEIYFARPKMCRDFPHNYGCPNCTYDPKRPREPGVRYAAIEDTGIFAHDYQPTMKRRLERMR